MEWTRGPHCSAPRGVCRREWSGVRCRDLPEDGRIAQYPLQKVEQDRGHHSGLPGNSGAARDPSQEVEQSRGRHSGLSGDDGAAQNPSRKVEQDHGGCWVAPESTGSLAEVRQWSELVTEPGSRRILGGALLVVEVVDGARLPWGVRAELSFC